MDTKTNHQFKEALRIIEDYRKQIRPYRIELSDRLYHTLNGYCYKRTGKSLDVISLINLWEICEKSELIRTRNCGKKSIIELEEYFLTFHLIMKDDLQKYMTFVEHVNKLLRQHPFSI